MCLRPYEIASSLPSGEFIPDSAKIPSAQKSWMLVVRALTSAQAFHIQHSNVHHRLHLHVRVSKEPTIILRLSLAHQLLERLPIGLLKTPMSVEARQNLL